MAHLEDAIPGLAEFTRWFAEDATRYVVSAVWRGR